MHVHSSTKRQNRNFFKEVNPFIRLMISADILINGATGLIGPVFAIFISNSIVGSSEMTAGIAAGLFLFTRSVAQIPIANFIDRNKGERDDFKFLVGFNLLAGLVPLFYLLISSELQLYAVQIVLGLCSAFTFPTFTALYTRHIDKDKIGTEWSIYYTFNDLSIAFFSAIGGFVAFKFGFHTLIMISAGLTILGTLVLLPARRLVFKK
jgi:MFS family permease